MSIVQISDFKGQIVIANSNQSYVAADLQIFIDKYEAKYLTILLGADLYQLLLDGDPTEEKWIALKAAIKGTANYIYWYYIADQDMQTVGIGQVKTQAANSYVVSPNYKMVRAWNEMVEESYNTVQFISTNTADYGNYYIENFYYNSWLNSYCNRPEIFQKINTFGI